MHSRSLFQRLMDNRPEPPSSRVDTARMVESVLEHLRVLFNAREGGTLTRTDYGLPDFNDLVVQFPAAIPALTRSIKHQVDLFEPRLRKVSVRHVPDPDRPLSLFFNISAELVLPEGDERVAFETVFGADGSVRVR